MDKEKTISWAKEAANKIKLVEDGVESPVTGYMIVFPEGNTFPASPGELAIWMKYEECARDLALLKQAMQSLVEMEAK